MPIRSVDKRRRTHYRWWLPKSFFKRMTKKEIDKEVAKALRDLADQKDAPLNQGGAPPHPEAGEVAQETHEAALKAFNTKGGRSLNSATPNANLEDLLKQEKAKE
jgi:hypothetical protein